MLFSKLNPIKITFKCYMAQQQHPDFIGIQKYKWTMSLFTAFILLFAILGSLCFHETYSRIIITTQLLYTFKCNWLFFWSFQSYRETNKILDRVERKGKTNILNPRKIYHAIVLPAYKEDKEILRNSLMRLAAHSQARETYLVFLALEERGG